jgi:hypothetical protein
VAKPLARLRFIMRRANFCIFACPSSSASHLNHALVVAPLSARRMKRCSRFLSSATSVHWFHAAAMPRCSARLTVRRRSERALRT